MATLLKNCRIYDGTGADAFTGDILIDADKIVEVAPVIDAKGADVIDICGKSVSSGFFDAHSHNDWFAAKREPQAYFEPFVRQGITSFITGNCGLSMTGFEPDSPYKDKIGAGLFHMENLTGEYPSAGTLFDAVDKKTPLNIASLVGHCSARASVNGYENRPLTQEEQLHMLAILEETLRQGACGVSLGLM